MEKLKALLERPEVRGLLHLAAVGLPIAMRDPKYRLLVELVLALEESLKEKQSEKKEEK